MSYDQAASQDFERALVKGFWRKVVSWLKGDSNELLPFDEVRGRLPIRGQHYVGHKEVPIDRIVGSLGRYRDFDRAFLPTQTRTKDRWINIDKAHYSQALLPAVELFKMGEIYFVKDGNHRVSVARERGQEFIDAFVIEIDVPVPMTPDMAVNDLLLKQEFAEFVERTLIHKLRPEARLETALPGQYAKLLDHIAVHRWYLGEQRGAEVPYAEGVTSWYDNVYRPLIDTLREHNLFKEFPRVAETDLYIWVMEYQGYLREMYFNEGAPVKGSTRKEEAARQLAAHHPTRSMRKLVNALRRAKWIDDLILQQEWAAFNEKTRLADLRPGAQIILSMPVQYEKLLEHIDVHRWYLGEQRRSEAPYNEAVASWYDNVYMPLVKIIREQGILESFPGRTEADLYLWIIEHQWYLRQEYGGEVPMEQAVERFTEEYSSKKKKR